MVLFLVVGKGKGYHLFLTRVKGKQTAIFPQFHLGLFSPRYFVILPGMANFFQFNFHP